MRSRRILRAMLAAAGLAAGALAPAFAEEIAVGNYGVAANGMPFAVALEKGFFKAEGANVTGIISSQGGGTSIRNMLAGGVAYGEANPGVDRGRDPAGRRPQDHQRQRAHRRRVRLGGEAGLADQDHQGLQGQEDRLHQSALDQPGAGDPAAAGGRAARRRTPSWSSTGGFGEGVAALDIGAIDVAPDGRAAVVQVQGQVPRRRGRHRHAAAARQRGRRHHQRPRPRRAATSSAR